MEVFNFEQGTEEWYRLRLGIPTASSFSKVIAEGKGIIRLAYMRQLAAETLTGDVVDTYTNKAMEWGSEKEPQARSMYELDSGYEVEQIGFCKVGRMGCSPDGLVGDSGLVEFKCPETTTQIETVLGGKMPTKHIAQVQGQMWITDREWCDFVSFDPRINGNSSFFKVRVMRDDDYINETLEPKMIKFLADLDAMLDKLGYQQ